eukprot:TRINITY_DN7117_c0_g1_i2.p1 TRINITY_DN7117_c0_g1~~TRINITY_DN7117_c0_g1_i2.p1  ORF type:complete len:296 (-),score=34.83 TRINITY_DN7117_c0_g1_i2:167-1054(-)
MTVLLYTKQAISGAVSRTATSPFERVIILKQTANPAYLNQGIFEMINNMRIREGKFSWFKGNGLNVLRIAPFTAMEFFSFEIYKQTLVEIKDSYRSKEAGSKGLSPLEFLLCGAVAGMTASTFTYPLDLLRTIFAIQVEKNTQKKSVWRVVRDIVKQKGFFSLYKGWGATMMGISPYCGLKLGIFQTIKNIFYGEDTNQRKMSDFANLAFGAIAGCGAVSVTYPTDLVRRRFQVKVLNAGNVVSGTILGEFKLVLKESGVRGLYHGIGATYWKVIPAVALTFALNERLKKILNVH